MSSSDSFVVDARLDDSDEIIQLPVVKSKLKKLLSTAVKKITVGNPPALPSSDDTLEEFLITSGKFFGKDPSEWVQVGEPQITVTESEGKRYIKSTGIFTGLELHLFLEPPLFDERLPQRSDRPDMMFSDRRRAITIDEEWQDAIRDQPLSISKRRQQTAAFLQAKMESGDAELMAEGCHGMWELAINRENHPDIKIDRLAALLKMLESLNIHVASIAAAAVWGLATTSSCRRNMVDLDVISIIITCLKRSLKMLPISDDDFGPFPTDLQDGTCTVSLRARYQRHLLGALAMLLVDRVCRRPYIMLEPNFTTLFELCKDLDGYQPEDAATRRETSAKVLTSLMQRDHEARESLINTGSLKSVIAHLNPQGPGKYMVQFCMASLLATMVLDEVAMEMLRDRGEAPLLFEACIMLLNDTLDKLHAEIARQAMLSMVEEGGEYDDSQGSGEGGQLDEEKEVREVGFDPLEGEDGHYDLALGVRLAEAISQAMWGSAYMCITVRPLGIKMSHILDLAKIGIDCLATEEIPLSRVCHCVTATLSTLASVEDGADLLMTCPNDLALKTMLKLCEVFETPVFERAGHVKAGACAGVAFLACHRMGAQGEECMTGPYRVKLLELGAFGTLLRAALTSVLDESCDMIVQQAAAIGAMFLTTMAGPVDATELALYSALLMDSNNSEMIEFLMAGMWILLRNPANRKVLGSSFAVNPANKAASGMASKLNDAITLHDVHDHAHDQAEMVKKMYNDGLPDEEQRRASAEGEPTEGAHGSPKSATSKAPSRTQSKAPSRAASSRVVSKPASESGLNPSAGDIVNEFMPDLIALNKDTVLDKPPVEGDCNEVLTLMIPDPAFDSVFEQGSQMPFGADGESPQNVDAEDQVAGKGLHQEPSSKRVAMSTENSMLSPSGFNKKSVRMAGAMSFARKSSMVAEDLMNEPLQHGSSSVTLSKSESEHHHALGKEAETKADDLIKKFDKQLKENWGLETLVAVGESWLPSMLEQDAIGEANDVPVLKLFEFLVASLCLFMIEDEQEAEHRELDLFKLTAPPGVRKSTWWTVEARAPEPSPMLDKTQERALHILVKIVGLHLPAAWKSMQLGVLTLWNVCSRSASMERSAIETLVAAKLLDIMNRSTWPASLRDMAGGCLEFLAERHSNLRLFPAVKLPTEVQWPYQKPPIDGLVPTIAGYINLINSKHPLLEYRGCHGIARICYAAPYGCPDGKEYVRDAKSVVTVLGGIDSLVSLLKRVNRRYQDWVTGKRGHTERRKADSDGDKFEKDMSSLEAQEDVYFVLFASLLNISVLKSVQPLVAKKGLMVLLGTNTMLAGRLAGGASSVVPVSDIEHKLVHLCSSIIQNISLHPQNRTRLYKAELAGAAALDKLIENALEAEELDEDTPLAWEASIGTSPLFPPIPGATSSSLVSVADRQGGNRRSKSHLSSPSRLHKTAANRHTRISPNGALLNGANSEVSLACSVRPKVAFPNIVEHRDAVAYSQSSLGGNQHGTRGSLANTTSSLDPNSAQNQDQEFTEGDQHNYGGEENGHGEEEELEEPLGGSDSRSRFMNWMDNTFLADERAAAELAAAAEALNGQRSYRKQMWDQNGDWLEVEPESSKALHRLLCRPINHLWLDSPEARLRHGQSRWEPAVSEYHQTSTDVPQLRAAAKLLTTQPPRDGKDLLHAANTHMTSQVVGHHSNTAAHLEDSNEHTTRPATRERGNGRVALTVLRPSLLPPVTEDAMSNTNTFRSDSLRRGEENPWDGLDESGKKKASKNLLPLKVCLGPKRPRQVISFEDKIRNSDDTSQPRLAIFEHIEGSRVSQGLFPSYQLPNGKQTFMYYSGGLMLDEVHVDAVTPPPRPTTVPQALQQAMPLAEVLNLISKPPGSAPPFIPYKPVPYLVPLPSKHTLMVKKPTSRSMLAFGDLREDNMQIIIQAKKIIRTQVSTRVESIEVARVEAREPWKLPDSIFKPRVKESDAKGFWDTDECEAKMFESDWARACGKEKFTGMLLRENKANKADPKEDKEMLDEVHGVLLEYYKKWYSAFVYYASGGAGDPYHMSLNPFTTFLDDCQIPDPESQYIKRSDCDTMFIVCNFQPDKKSAAASVNNENALMRYEFLECLCRAGIAKYGKGQQTDNVAEAVKMLLEENIAANLSPAAGLVSNDFRRNRLYNEEVDTLLKRHALLLKALYSRYRLKPPGGGLRSKMLRLEGWVQLMNDAHLIDAQFTLQDATLSFLWSRMQTIDEVKDYQRYTCLTFVDFLEALGRVADSKSLPLESDLESAGYASILDWAIEKERIEAPDGAAKDSGRNDDDDDHHHGHAAALDIFRTRESAGLTGTKGRPLYSKLELLLDLIFRRLFWDPAQPEVPFSYDGLLKIIKKIDKEMGP